MTSGSRKCKAVPFSPQKARFGKARRFLSSRMRAKTSKRPSSPHHFPRAADSATRLFGPNLSAQTCIAATPNRALQHVRRHGCVPRCRAPEGFTCPHADRPRGARCAMHLRVVEFQLVCSLILRETVGSDAYPAHRVLTCSTPTLPNSQQLPTHSRAARVPRRKGPDGQVRVSAAAAGQRRAFVLPAAHAKRDGNHAVRVHAHGGRGVPNVSPPAD